ncbi:PREDICTED: uncharacterized protein LOC107342171 [Acropora digitifera]|uniref:uncharacterized protein LOC107342171 n=1 Tax=Acropora digitifera TaxID=70779 RepID=UPI00077A0726|nr:PREDICTED: uncharacterized protein LOC107342171 [Acropora digitifera]
MCLRPQLLTQQAKLGCIGIIFLVKEAGKHLRALNSLIRNQEGKQVDTLFADAVKDFQGHLISKASEVDQLRVDLQNMEHKEKNLFTSFTSQKGGNPVQSTFSRTQYGTGAGNVRAVSSGYSNPPFQSAGLRETNAQIDDLKRKLKMTTELCAKQDAYYRGVVSDLENQIKESIAGRDHVLAIRESESSGQLRLIHQLEAGLRNQQQVIDTKDEVRNGRNDSLAKGFRDTPNERASSARSSGALQMTYRKLMGG